MEIVAEEFLYASRWLLAPIYPGLSAGLIRIVMLSGYESFILSAIGMAYINNINKH